MVLASSVFSIRMVSTETVIGRIYFFAKAGKFQINKLLQLPLNKLITIFACSSFTGEYWPSIAFARTSLRLVPTVTTSGQYSPKRPPQKVIIFLFRLSLIINHWFSSLLFFKKLCYRSNILKTSVLIFLISPLKSVCLNILESHTWSHYGNTKIDPLHKRRKIYWHTREYQLINILLLAI